jgi:hypothetical protein
LEIGFGQLPRLPIGTVQQWRDYFRANWEALSAAISKREFDRRFHCED